MAKAKVQLAGGLPRIVTIDTAATEGADIGTNLRYGGQVQTLAQLQALFGGGASSSSTTGGAIGANPSATIGLTAVNGASRAFLRSDAAPALSQAITPTWTGVHKFTNYDNTATFATTTGMQMGAAVAGVYPVLGWSVATAAANTKVWDAVALPSGSLLFRTVSDDYVSTVNWLAVARTATAITAMVYGNATDNPTHGFYGPATFNWAQSLGAYPIILSSAGPRVLFTNTSGAVDYKNWDAGAGTTSWALRLRTDAFPGTTVDALNFTRVGVAVTAMAYGNSTDNPTHTFYGGIVVNAATGGDQGDGTINATGLYINGVAVGSSSGANPTASVGITATNGVATTFMRSDAAPALSQSISPTWSGTHTFSNPLLGPNGSNTAPAYSFSSDPDTGMYRSAANVLNFATAGTSRFSIGAGGAAAFTSSVQAMGYDLTAGSGVTNGMYLQASGDVRFGGAGVEMLRLNYNSGTQQATFAGMAITAASTSTQASLRLPHGSAPSSPTDGDMWTTTSGLYVRINGSTIGPLT